MPVPESKNELREVGRLSGDRWERFDRLQRNLRPFLCRRPKRPPVDASVGLENPGSRVDFAFRENLSARNCSPGFFNLFVIFVCFCADFLRDLLQRAGLSISIFCNQGSLP
jgi:hypothetical protein